MIPRVLVIAGSDSGGGAGIQADIKTIIMLGGHALSAITAITAQNTLGVAAVHCIPPKMVVAQIDAVWSDIGVDAIKVGMLGSAATAEALADRLATCGVPLVVDPVMVATSGAALADRATIAALDRLMELATLVTPNAAELATLGGDEALQARGLTYLAKGGDLDGETVIDRLVGPAGEIARWEASRIVTRHDHGTGCTLASAITVGLARGDGMIEAIERARRFVRAALAASPRLGGGHGPIGQALGLVPFDHLAGDTALSGWGEPDSGFRPDGVER